MTENHVRLLKRWTKNVILLFDGDQAGQTASERSLVHFFKHDLLPQVFSLPEEQDPDDYITLHGKEKFLEDASRSEDLFFNLLNRWMGEYRGQPKDKIQVIDKVTPLLKTLSDQRLLQMYVEEVARRLNEEPRKVYAWIMGGDKPKVAPVQTLEPQPQESEALITLGGVTEDD